MTGQLNKKLFWLTFTGFTTAILVWTILFFSNPVLKDVLVEIHIIFTTTLLSYFIILFVFKTLLLDFIKVFIRTLFRVWLLIFITFAVSHSMDRIGFLLTVTFILGYIEGLLDIDKWLQGTQPFPWLLPAGLSVNKINRGVATILLMSVIHILCAMVVMLFYIFFF